MSPRVGGRLVVALLYAALLTFVGTAAVAAATPSVDAGFDGATAFRVAYVVNKDGSVDVTQDISWHFPQGEERHGIFRTITVQAGYQDSQTQYRYYELSDISVTSPSGAPTDLSIDDFGTYKKVRIGSPDQTVTGTQRYVLKFHLAHVVNDIEGKTAEFYYDMVDSANDNEIQGISATVTGPVAATKAVCFRGILKSTEQCSATPGAVAKFTVADLAPGEGATIATSYPRAAFGDLTPDLRESNENPAPGWEPENTPSVLSPTTASSLGWLAIGAGGALPLLAGALMGLLVWKRGRDEQYAGVTPGLTPGLGQDFAVVRSARHPVVAVRFTPPDGVQPGMVGTVMDEEANLVDVSATIVDLAVRGYLTISRGDPGSSASDDWLLTRTAPPAGAAPLVRYEQTLHDQLFAAGDSVWLSSLKNSFSSVLSIVQSEMYSEVVERGWFRRSPAMQRRAWQSLGVLLMVGGGFALFFLSNFLGELFRAADLPVAPLVVLGVGLLLSGVIVFVLGRRMASRTAAGSAVYAQSLGFEKYLVTAEAGQIRWEEAQDIFSRFLPYAIVFGCADRWAKTFEAVAAAAAASGVVIAPPMWYAGPLTTWNFGDVANGMDSFSTMAAGTFVSTPGSSGGSAFGDGGFGGGSFDGGGFSGGGGGGDSGGSW